MRRPSRLSSILLVSLSACSAPLDIQVIGRPGIVLAPTPAGECQVPLYGEKDSLPKGCEVEIADVFLGEEGNTATANCSYDRVYEEAIRQACLAGADMAQVVMSQAPRSNLSTCYQMRVRLLRCEGAK